MKNYLITGGFGFIGLNIINEILKRDLGNIGVIEYMESPTSDKRISVLANSIEDQGWIKEEMNYDGVIILAGISGRDISDEKLVHKLNVDVNVALVKKLVEHNKKNIHVIIPSSQLVYENSENSSETLDHSPSHLYAYSKIELERNLFDLSSKESRVTITSFRISNPFGPHIPHPQNYNYANQMLYKLWSDERIELFQKGESIKNYLPVQNLAKIFVNTIENNLFANEIVNVGHYEDIKMKDFYVKAQNIFNKGKVSLTKGGIVDSIKLDTSKLYNSVDRSSLMDIEESLKVFDGFYTKHQKVEMRDLI